MAVPGGPDPDRRRFLRCAALLAAGTPVVALGACSRGGRPVTPPDVPIAAPEAPVRWDVAADNAPIPDGLGPEKGANLRVYSYSDYIAPGAIRSFEKTYGVTVEVATFNSTDDALARLRDGGADYDVYTPGYDQIGRLVTWGLLCPLNHRYIPGITNLWPFFTDPWYDREWRYTVPYTVYTTGIGWRTDLVQADIAKSANPYDSLWDPKYRDKTAIIDDWHTAMAMVLLKLGITDVNTAAEDDLAKVGYALDDLFAATAPAITSTATSEMDSGAVGLSQMWSGDMITASRSLPEGVSPDILRYWFPADGRGLVDNDLMVVLRGGRNPVLAHLFINHMLDPYVAGLNFAATGYQPPQISIKPDALVRDGVIPAGLAAAVVRPEYFDTGYRILELTPANRERWERIWRDFKTRRP